MLIPYRVKNPWKKLPIATLSLIAINVLVFLLTSEGGLEIKETVARLYAYQLGVSPLFNLVTAMFLHADILHLAGNMLFFWVFGPSVEDRLGIPRYLLLYFTTGIMACVAQGLLDIMMHGTTLPGIGASGCIMGVLGAYWYLFSWSTVCVFYWFGWFIRGVWEVEALWIIGLFILIDLIEGIVYGGANGVANFAHLGGGISGVLLCMALRMPRDSEALSHAKASHADMKDLSLVSLVDLDIMRRHDPQNPEILQAMLSQAIMTGHQNMLHRAFADAGPTLIMKDPRLVARYLLKADGDPTIYTPSHLIRIARSLEETTSKDDAANAIDIYRLVLQYHKDALDNELTLFRLASCYWQKYHDAARAKTCLQEQLTRYPYGSMEEYARALLRQIGE